MHKTSLVVLTALLAIPACGQEAAEPEKQAAEATPEKPAEAAPDEAPEPEPAGPAAEMDPWQKKLESRVLADSGIGVGGKLSAFDIVNCESGEEYCQVCRYGGSPKIMVVGAPDDDRFKANVKDVDAIVKKYGEDKVKAFAVVTDIADGKALTPRDRAAAQKKADALRQELAVSMPVVIPSPGEEGGNRVWDEYYNITKSPTIMFADGRNEVKYSAVGPDDFAALNDAIKAVVSG
jgi:hypothetical protein